MMTKDVDLLIYEPGLFKTWRIEHQSKGKGGDGVMSGTAFSAAGGNFVAAGVEAGDVVTLTSVDGMIDGCFEVVAVVSATQLTVSVVRGDETQGAVPVGTGTSLIWRISSFGPQRAAAERMMLDRVGLDDTAAAALDEASLRRLRMVIVSAALVMVFESLIQLEDDVAVLGRKKDVYRRAAEAALVQLRLEFDVDGDGDTDHTLRGGAVQMERE